MEDDPTNPPYLCPIPTRIMKRSSVLGIWLSGAALMLLCTCSHEFRYGIVRHLVPANSFEEPLIVRSRSRLGLRSSSGQNHRITFEVPSDGATLLLSRAYTSEESLTEPKSIVFEASLSQSGERHVGLFKRRDRRTDATIDLAPYAGPKLDVESVNILYALGHID